MASRNQGTNHQTNEVLNQARVSQLMWVLMDKCHGTNTEKMGWKTSWAAKDICAR